MKSIFPLLALLLGYFLSIPKLIYSTTPARSFWYKNLSEGDDEITTGLKDYNPEIAVSGKIVHVVWLTDTESGKALFYKRSADNGITWQPKVKLIDGAIDASTLYNRLAVSRDFVHIIANDLSYDSKLYYFRSVDGGSNFEPIDTLYQTPYAISNLQIRAELSRIFISYTWECHFCSPLKTLYLTKSEDNGATFSEPSKVLDDFSGLFSYFNELQVSGNYVYLTYLESVGIWYNYDYQLHVVCSADGGSSFVDRIVSTPASNGNHHSFFVLDNNSRYVPKLAAEGSRMVLTWEGWNSLDEPVVFTRRSTDGGISYEDPLIISGDIHYLQTGMCNLTLSGDQVYVLFLQPDSRAFLAHSSNGGISFDAPQEITLSQDEYLKMTWDPKLFKDPFLNETHILGTGVYHARVTPKGDVEPDYYGHYTLVRSRRPQMAWGPNGIIHLIFEGGELNGDDEIWYRRLETAYIPAPSDTNYALRLQTNTDQYENMVISPALGETLTDAITVELWVKPDTIDKDIRILTQLHDQTWNLGNPLSFQLWATAGWPVCGIVTSTGSYVLSGSEMMHQGVWNHMAVSYADNDEADNFKLLLNGRVIASTTAAGPLEPLQACWFLGNTGFVYEGFSGDVDELRFWNIAVPEDTIRERLYASLNGNEKGLVAYYSFDEISPFGQVYDHTKNGHQGTLMYMESLEISSLKNPQVGIEFIQNTNDLYFTANSNVRDKFEWDFGDGQSSDQVNPRHQYESPGVYEVCLFVEGEENIGSACRIIEIEGIQKVNPQTFGNDGTIMVSVYGGGLDEFTMVYLSKEGMEDIHPLSTEYYEPDQLTAVFTLFDAALGDWIFNVQNMQSGFYEARSIKIVEARKPDPWANVSGPGTVLVNRWTTFTISYGNNGDMDALAVPLQLVVSEIEGLQINFLDIDFSLPQEIIDEGYQFLDTLSLFTEIDTLFLDPFKGRLYSFIIPVIPAGTSDQVRIRIKSPERYQLQATVMSPLISFIPEDFSRSLDGDWVATLACLSSLIGEIAFDQIIGNTGSDLAGCLNQVMKRFANVYSPFRPKGKRKWYHTFRVWTFSSVKCGFHLASLVGGNIFKTNPIYLAFKTAYNFNKYLISYPSTAINCIRLLFVKTSKPLSIFTVASFDPNEKYGPEGYASDHFIARNDQLNYRISFENKSSATAPAQEVFVYDTLDGDVFDLNAFSLGVMGFGDTVVYPPTGFSEYAQDLDLRPNKNTIVRIAANLDTTSRVVTWHFSSLDPENMELTEDAFGGFLPPNVNSPEGEGFVSYSIGVYPDQEDEAIFRNKATIIFDANTPIITNETKNRFDGIPPKSSLALDQVESDDSSALIYLDGSDRGAGIQYFEIYISQNDSAYNFLRTIAGDRFEFLGQPGISYKMFSLAIDSVGNREIEKNTEDVEISFVTNTSELSEFGPMSLYPNLTKKSLILEFHLQKNANLKAEIFDLIGRHRGIVLQGNYSIGNYKIPVHLDLDEGMYFLVLSSSNQIKSKRFQIIR